MGLHDFIGICHPWGESLNETMPMPRFGTDRRRVTVCYWSRLEIASRKRLFFCLFFTFSASRRLSFHHVIFFRSKQSFNLVSFCLFKRVFWCRNDGLKFLTIILVFCRPCLLHGWKKSRTTTFSDWFKFFASSRKRRDPWRIAEKFTITAHLNNAVNNFECSL